MHSALELRGKHYKSVNKTNFIKQEPKAQFYDEQHKLSVQKNQLTLSRLSQQTEYDQMTQGEKIYWVRKTALLQASHQCIYGFKWDDYGKFKQQAGKLQDLAFNRCHYSNMRYTDDYCYSCWKILQEAESQIEDLSSVDQLNTSLRI